MSLFWPPYWSKNIFLLNFELKLKVLVMNFDYQTGKVVLLKQCCHFAKMGTFFRKQHRNDIPKFYY